MMTHCPTGDLSSLSNGGELPSGGGGGEIAPWREGELPPGVAEEEVSAGGSGEEGEGGWLAPLHSFPE